MNNEDVKTASGQPAPADTGPFSGDRGDTAPSGEGMPPFDPETAGYASPKETVSRPDPLLVAHFRFTLIAPVISGTFTEASAAAYYRRIAEKEHRLPDGSLKRYSPATFEKWTKLYKNGGMDGLMPSERADKGQPRVLDEKVQARIFEIMEKYPKIPCTGIHSKLVTEGLITLQVSVRAIQRFVKGNPFPVTGASAPKDRRPFETEAFGCVWQTDTCYTDYITENGESRRTYLMIIVDDHTRMLVAGQFFYEDNAANFQILFKQAVETYGVPDILYTDHGASFENKQLTFITDSLGVSHRLAPVRDGASKGKVERTFGTIKTRWLFTLDIDDITSLEEFNRVFRDYIREHNLTVNKGTGETPMARYLRTMEHIRTAASAAWIDECFTNRHIRKVRNDATIRIDNVFYSVDPAFIKQKVEIRFVPGHMENAYIYSEGKHYPVTVTDKTKNSDGRRRKSLPGISYAQKEDK